MRTLTSAATLVSAAVLHVSAHLANVASFSTSYSEDFPALNVARYRGEVRLPTSLLILSLLKALLRFIGDCNVNSVVHLDFRKWAEMLNSVLGFSVFQLYFSSVFPPPGPQTDHFDHK